MVLSLVLGLAVGRVAIGYEQRSILLKGDVYDLAYHTAKDRYGEASVSGEFGPDCPQNLFDLLCFCLFMLLLKLALHFLWLTHAR